MNTGLVRSLTRHHVGEGSPSRGALPPLCMSLLSSVVSHFRRRPGLRSEPTITTPPPTNPQGDAESLHTRCPESLYNRCDFLRRVFPNEEIGEFLWTQDGVSWGGGSPSQGNRSRGGIFSSTNNVFPHQRSPCSFVCAHVDTILSNLHPHPQ